VANVSQGVTVTWGAVTLGELVTVAVDGVTADAVEVTSRNTTNRLKKFSAADIDGGTVSVTVRGTAGMATTSVGLTAALSIGGPGVTWSFPSAMFQTLGWSASVGELQTFSVTFKIGAA
jgi:hypothetical protein